MRKKLNTLVALLILMIGSAMASVSGSHLPINSGNIGYDSVKIFTSVTSISYTGNYQTKIICKKTGDSSWISGDTITTSGTGVKNSSIKRLQSNTLYSFARVFWKDSTARDTLFGTVTFTTLAAPKFPTISVQVIPKIGISELIITATITNGTSHAYQVYALYGDMYQYYSDTMSDNTTKKDTLHLITPNANQQILYGIWLHDVIVGDTTLNWSSFTTPQLVGDSITASVVSTGTDSVTLRANVIRNGDGASTLTFIVKDSTGSSTIGTQTVAVIGTGFYPKTFYSLLDNKLYRWYVVSVDTLGTDTISGFFRTKVRIPNQPPTAYFVMVNGPTSECDSIELEGYNITRAGTDVGKAFLVSAINDSNVLNMRDTLDVITVDRNIFKNRFRVHAPELGVRYYYRFVTRSSDNLTWVSPAISAPTASAEQPIFQIDTVGYTTSHPAIHVAGNTFCQDLTIYLTTYNNTTGQIWYDTVFIPKKAESFHVVVQQPNLPAGQYSISGNLRSGRWSNIFYSIPGQVVRGNIATGVKQNVFENISIYPNPTNGDIAIKGLKEKVNVKVFNMAGSIIFDESNVEQVNIKGNSAGLYFMQITNEEGKSITEKIRLQ